MHPREGGGQEVRDPGSAVGGRGPAVESVRIGGVVGHAEAIRPLTDSQKVRILPGPLKWFLVGRQTYPEREKKRPLGCLAG